MALLPVSVPLFPDVPNVPGVPGLIQQVGANLPIPIRALGDSLGLGFLFAPGWGIFDKNGQPVIIGDSVLSIEYHIATAISDYPTQKGGFASYNKVQIPWSARVTFAVGGSFSVNSVISAINSTSVLGALKSLSGEAARTEFLRVLDAAVDSLDLYKIVTPERVYASANVVKYDFHRDAASGATMMTIDVYLDEVRIIASHDLNQTQQASSQDATNNGNVQAIPAGPVTSEPLPNLTPK